MVNKAVVGVIGIVLITTLGVGALVGLQGGGAPAEDGDPNDDGNGGPADGTATDATSPDGAAGNGTAGNGTATTPTGTPAPDALALTRSEFTAAEIEANLTSRLNEWRTGEGLERLEIGPGTTKEKLQAMARAHSANMAAAGTVAHGIDNDTTRTRYEANDLYYACGFKPPNKQYTALPGQPDVQQFEWISGTAVETSFSRDRGILFHENESAVATTIVDQWAGDEATEYGLLSPNYGKAGVGVNVTRDGTVYATVHLCGT